VAKLPNMVRTHCFIACYARNRLFRAEIEKEIAVLRLSTLQTEKAAASGFFRA
jgi:hypothetical protein